jgi:hypothetical protein
VAGRTQPCVCIWSRVGGGRPTRDRHGSVERPGCRALFGMPLARPPGAWAAQRLMTTHRFRALAIGLACERLFAAISLQAGPGPSSLFLADRCFTAEQTQRHKRRKVQTIERDTNQCARSIREARWEEVDRGAGAGSSGSAAREGRRAMRGRRKADDVCTVC